MDTNIEDLEAANAELVNDYNKLVEEFNELQNKYTELQQENENLTAEINGDDEEVPEVDDGLPYFIDSKGRKRDKRTKRFWKEPEIDTSSPLIPEKKNDNDEDDTETDPAEEKVEEIPVGAAPPTTKNSSKGTSKRSERYNPDFYNQGNTSGKGNKRK